MQRCTRCIMPSTVPGISFNDDGVCCFCSDYHHEPCLKEKELQEIIESAKNKDNKYDCIVPLSGGRDSTFILYLAKAVYKLKVLAVSFDNEFRTDQALMNMKNACKALNVDFISVRSKRDFARKIVLYGIRNVLPQGPYAISHTMCHACAYGNKSVVYIAAEKYKVPLILWGESKNESTMDMQLKANPGQRMSKLRMLFDVNIFLRELYRLLLRYEFHVPGNPIISRSPPILKNKNIKEVHLYDYIEWDRKKIKETIMKELGWKKPSDTVSTWRIDCFLHHLVNHCFFNMYGCSKDSFGYCRMINSGQMNREEALYQEEFAAKDILNKIQGISEKSIGLSKKEAAIIESLKNKIL